MKLEPCPFCGNSAQDDGIGYLANQSHTVEEDGYEQWDACVECLHCMAQSGHFGADTAEEAAELARQNWNSAGRPTWWQRNIIRRWVQLQYDVRLWFEKY
jgi:hypothetical protein